MTVYTVLIEKDPITNEHIIQLPESLISELGWEENEELMFTENENGSVTVSSLTKVLNAGMV